MQNTLLRFFLCALLLSSATGNAWAQIKAGTIKAARVEGTVSRVAANGTLQPIVNGAILTENDIVVTGAGSGVVLVFMNGSSVKLGAASRIAIEEFKMDPLAEDIVVAQLIHEPSVSKTTLNLAYGELVGDVKKLNKSSSYSIKSPAGAAGIRGTTFRIVFTPSADGKTFNFQLSTAEGLVVFSGSAGAVPVEVASKQEVAVQANVNTVTGEVSNLQVQSLGITPEATRAIEAAVTSVIQQAQAEAVFTRTEQESTASNPAATVSEETPAAKNTTSENKSEPESPLPNATTPQPIDPSTVSRSS